MCVHVCVCVCVCVCAWSLDIMVWVIFLYVFWVLWALFFLCLAGCFSMIILTPAVLSVLHACVLYFCICTCSAQPSVFHMERRSRNTLIIIININYLAIEVVTPQLSVRPIPSLSHVGKSSGTAHQQDSALVLWYDHGPGIPAAPSAHHTAKWGCLPVRCRSHSCHGGLKMAGNGWVGLHRCRWWWWSHADCGPSLFPCGCAGRTLLSAGFDRLPVVARFSCHVLCGKIDSCLFFYTPTEIWKIRAERLVQILGIQRYCLSWLHFKGIFDQWEWWEIMNKTEVKNIFIINK